MEKLARHTARQLTVVLTQDGDDSLLLDSQGKSGSSPSKCILRARGRYKALWEVAGFPERLPLW